MRKLLMAVLVAAWPVLGQTHIYRSVQPGVTAEKEKVMKVFLSVVAVVLIFGMVPALAQSLRPDQISGLQFWVKADSLQAASNPYSNNAQVDSAYNWGAVGGALTQTTAGQRPLFKTGISPTGLPGLLFDGADDYMSMPSSTTLFNFMHTLSTPNTAVLVLWIPSVPAVTKYIFTNSGNNSGASSSNGFLFYHGASGGLAYHVGRNANAPALSRTLTSKDLSLGITIAVVTYDEGENPDYRGRIDGAQTDSADTGSHGTGNATNNVSLGFSSNTFSGYIFEAALYDERVSNANLASLIDHLFVKWCGPAFTENRPVGFDTVSTTDHRVVLKWNSVTGVDSYRVYRRHNPYAPVTYPNSLQIGSTNDTTYTDIRPPSLVTPGVTFEYTVRSVYDDTLSLPATQKAVPVMARNRSVTNWLQSGLIAKWLTGEDEGDSDVGVFFLRRRLK